MALISEITRKMSNADNSNKLIFLQTVGRGGTTLLFDFGGHTARFGSGLESMISSTLRTAKNGGPSPHSYVLKHFAIELTCWETNRTCADEPPS